MGDGSIDSLSQTLRHLDLDFYRECETYSGDDPVLQARRVLVVNKGGFNGYLNPGTPPVGGWHQKGKWRVDWCWKLDKITNSLAQLQNLLKGRLSCECVSVFESPYWNADVVYADPPYVKEGGKMYGKSGVFDHHRFRSLLASHVSREWILSYDDCTLVRELYSDYTPMEMNVLSSRGLVDGKLKKKGEVLIVNPPPLTPPFHSRYKKSHEKIPKEAAADPQKEP